MALVNEIHEEVIAAMKSKNSLRRGILKLMKSELQNNAMAEEPMKTGEGVLLTDVEVLTAYHKKLSKGLKSFEGDLLDNLKKELTIMEEFLPKVDVMTKEEIEEIVAKHISLGNMGAVMKAVRAEMTKPFDGKLVNQTITAKLAECRE